jgi:hypothetical protein
MEVWTELMKTTAAFITLFVGTLAAAIVVAQKPVPVAVDVFRSPTCGCCMKWVEHLRHAGFQVTVKDLEQDALDKVKAQYRVPQAAQSCHTARVAGYTVEGHVPADAVEKLLKTRPAVAGIAVGGMPTGSPGMEVPSGRKQPFDVVSFGQDGTTKVFASYNR